jgi:predicted aminopeptidase
VADDRAVAELLARFRAAVAALYAEELHDASERRALEEQTREQLATLPLRSLDASALAAGLRLNDACQALAGAYETDLPAYAARLDALGGDLPGFLAAARAAAESSEPRCALLGVCDHDQDSGSSTTGSLQDLE